MNNFLLQILVEKNAKIAVAESCTGGLLGSEFTNIQGSSEIFLGGIIAYNNIIKKNVLNVPFETLNLYTEYSKECVLEMAQNIMSIFKSNIAISVSAKLPINTDINTTISGYYCIIIKDYSINFYTINTKDYLNLSRQIQKEKLVQETLHNLKSLDYFQN